MQQHESPNFSSWAIVEVMGHGRFAGFVTAEAIAGPMLRVDVPEVDGRPAFTKYLAPSSLFAVTPCTEQSAREAAKQFRARPVSMFEMPMLAGPRQAHFFDDDNDDDDEDDDTFTM